MKCIADLFLAFGSSNAINMFEAISIIVYLNGGNHRDIFYPGPGYDSPDISKNPSMVSNTGRAVCEEKILLGIDVDKDSFRS